MKKKLALILAGTAMAAMVLAGGGIPKTWNLIPVRLTASGMDLP